MSCKIAVKNIFLYFPVATWPYPQVDPDLSEAYGVWKFTNLTFYDNSEVVLLCFITTCVLKRDKHQHVYFIQTETADQIKIQVVLYYSKSSVKSL